MIFPAITAWMEQRNDRSSVGVHTTQIGALVAIAAVTRPRQILGSCRPTMLSRNNVFEVKRFERWKPVREVTVFTSPTGPLANGSAKRFAHFSGDAEASRRSAFKR